MMPTREQVEEVARRRGLLNQDNDMDARVRQVAMQRGLIPQESQAPQEEEEEERGNPYDRLTPMNWLAKSLSDQNSDFMTGVRSFNESSGKYPLGLIQLIAPEAAKRVAEERRADVSQRAQTSPNSALLGDLLGDLNMSRFAFGAGDAGAQTILPNFAKSGASFAQKMGLEGLAGALGGLGLGASKYVGEDESRLENALTEGGLGAVLGAASPIAGKAFGLAKDKFNDLAAYTNPEKKLAKSFIENLNPKEQAKAMENAKLAEQYGLKLTPAEAAGSPIQASAEGALGVTLPAKKALFEAKEGQKQAQQKLIDKLLRDISPDYVGSPARDVREAAEGSIAAKEKALQKKAKPFYEKAEKAEISRNRLNSLLRDRNIHDAFWDVSESSVYANKLKNVPLTSLKRLDQVKKNMDVKIENLMKVGDRQDKHAAGLINKAKDKLVAAMDSISPDYAKGRGIYEEGSPAIDLLRKGDVARIANLSDPQLQSASKIIFDPGETSPEAFALVRDAIKGQNPKAWDGIVRLEIERRIAALPKDQTGNAGSNFYNAILKNDTSFEQFVAALEGNQKAQIAMFDLRELFRDLINSYTPKTEHGFQKTHVSLPRSTMEAVEKLAIKMFGGKYDEAAVELITSGKWQDKFSEIMRDKALSSVQKQEKTLTLLNDISKLPAVRATQRDEDEDEE